MNIPASKVHSCSMTTWPFPTRNMIAWLEIVILAGEMQVKRWIKGVGIGRVIRTASQGCGFDCLQNSGTLERQPPEAVRAEVE